MRAWGIPARGCRRTRSVVGDEGGGSGRAGHCDLYWLMAGQLIDRGSFAVEFDRNGDFNLWGSCLKLFLGKEWA